MRNILIMIIVLSSSLTGFSQLCSPLLGCYNMKDTIVNACNGTFKDSDAGGLTSGYTYANNENFTMTFCSNNGQKLIFNFTTLSIKSGDFLKIYDGPNTSSNLIFDISSTSTNPVIVISTGTCLTFKFTSDNSGNLFSQNGNWEATFSCGEVARINEPGVINSCDIIFIDSGLNADYGNNESFTKTFCPGTSGNCVKVEFLSFNVESANDRLEVYDGANATGAPMMTYTGTNIPNTLSASNTGKCLTFKFTSNSSVTRAGWTARITCPSACMPPCNPNSPPASDLCANAPPICDLNGYCGNTSGNYCPDYPGNLCSGGGSSSRPAPCNTPSFPSTSGCQLFGGSIENNSWLKFISNNTSASFNVYVINCTGGNGIQMGIYEGVNCNNFVLKSDFALTQAGTQQGGTMVITANNLTPGNIYYIMVDGFGGAICDYVVEAISGVQLGIDITPDQTICAGLTANIEITGSGLGSNPIVWQSNPPGFSATGTSITVQPTQTTMYFTNISDSSGFCAYNNTISTTITVLQNCNITCNISSNNNTLCSTTNCNGSANISIDGGSGNYNYLWSNNADTSDITNLCAGIYSVTVNDLTFNTSCTASTTIISPIAPTSNFSISTPICQGNTTTISADNQYQNGQYIWDFGGGTIISGGTGQGPHVIKYNNSGAFNVSLYIIENACTSSTTTKSINVINATIPNISTNSPICAGQNLILSTDNAVNYNWTGPNNFNSTLQNITINNANSTNSGTYSVTITDNMGCINSNNINVTVTPNPIVSINSNNVSCYGLSNGSATAIVSSGTSPFNYSWSNNGTNQSINNIPAGIYTITATDINNCKSSASTTISQPNSPMSYSSVENNVSCFGGSDGFIHLTVIGGTSPYAYVWSNGKVTQNIDNIQHGTYSFTVSDANNCTLTDSINISQPLQALNVTLSKQNILCYGQNTGNISLTTSGGTSPYIYTWSNGSTNQNLNNVAAGVYQVTVSDIYSCPFVISTTITQPNQALSHNVSQNDTICYGENSHISTTASGGTPPYTYNWTDNFGQSYSNSPTLSISPTLSTTYNINIVDNNGCTSPSKSIIISVDDSLKMTLTTNNVKCNNACNGSAIINMLSGHSPYTYSWTSNQNTLNNICPGNYNVTITDSWNCSITTTFNITEPSALAYSLNTSPASCYQLSDGTSTVNVTGGTSPYNYSWSNGISNANSITAVAGNYITTITDSNNCQLIVNSTITEPQQLLINSPENKTICKGQNVLLNVNSQGGTSPINYFWYIPGTGAITGQNISITPTQSGTYNVYAKDANGCISATKNFVISIYPNISLSITKDKDKICPGEEISVNAQISGGNGGPYICTLNDGSVVSPPFKLKPEGNDTIIGYNLNVTDFCNSQGGNGFFSIQILPKPNVSFSSDITKGCQPLTVTFNENGTNGNQTNIWNFNDYGNNITGTTKTVVHTFNDYGLYDINLSVITEDGCKNSLTLYDYIEVYKNPKSRFTPDPIITSILKPNIDFINYSSDNLVNIWNFGDGATSFDESPFHKYSNSGTYNVTLIVESEKSCKDTSVINVVVKDEYTFYAPNAFTPNFDGSNDLFYISGTGINPDYFQMMIYDRWGEVVYQTSYFNPDNHSENGWDGKIKNKTYAETGSYVWHVVFKDVIGVEHQYSGNVTVVR